MSRATIKQHRTKSSKFQLNKPMICKQKVLDNGINQQDYPNSK